MTAKTNDKGKHSPPGAGNIYAKANEVIVKITGDDTAQTFEVVEENCKPGFQSRAHYHIKPMRLFTCSMEVRNSKSATNYSTPRKDRAFIFRPACPHQVTSKGGVRMLMIYSPAGTEGMFAGDARSYSGAFDKCRTHETARAQARHGDDRAEQGWPRQRYDFLLIDRRNSSSKLSTAILRACLRNWWM